MSKASSVAVLICATCFAIAHGQEYNVSEIDGLPSDAPVPAELAKQFSSQGVKVTLNSSRTVCEIWLCEQLELVENFEESEVLLYPFYQGQLVGMIHFPRRSSEFREQTIQSGWYTLRFELQPVDGNHVGTSPTRDFLLMVKAEEDEVDKDWQSKDLLAASAEVAGSSHPAMLCLQRIDKSVDKKTAIRHNEELDWWILRLLGKGSAAGQNQDVVIDLVVAGHAAE